MKKARLTEEQIIDILQEHKAGAKCADLCRKYGMSEGMFHGSGPVATDSDDVIALLCGSLQTHPGTFDAVGGGHIIRAHRSPRQKSAKVVLASGLYMLRSGV